MQKKILQQLFDHYKNVDEEKLWENLEYFIKEIIPVAEEAVTLKWRSTRMIRHRDIFGLPRIITNKENLERFHRTYMIAQTTAYNV